jgi:hypothetical protein
MVAPTILAHDISTTTLEVTLLSLQVVFVSDLQHIMWFKSGLHLFSTHLKISHGFS